MNTILRMLLILSLNCVCFIFALPSLKKRILKTLVFYCLMFYSSNLKHNHDLQNNKGKKVLESLRNLPLKANLKDKNHDIAIAMSFSRAAPDFAAALAGSIFKYI